MKIKIGIAVLAIAVVAAPIVSFASDDSDADRSHPGAFVKDSVITTKIKSKLAANHVTSLARIHVDTDANGYVWLRGTTKTQDTADLAVSIARDTEGVKDVHSNIIVKADE